ncbi:MAG: hypothetical protein V3V26_01535 [Candidatus Aenigmarchaeota archaeon]
MGANRGIGRYLKTAKDYAVEYSYLGFSALFCATGLGLTATDDLKKLGYGLLGAGITQAIYGTGKRLRERRMETARQRKDKRMEIKMARMARDVRKLLEKELREEGRRVRLNQDAVEELGEVSKDTDCALEMLKEMAPRDRKSSVEIDAGEVRKYIERKRLEGLGEDPPCMDGPGYPA